MRKYMTTFGIKSEKSLKTVFGGEERDADFVVKCSIKSIIVEYLGKAKILFGI